MSGASAVMAVRWAGVAVPPACCSLLAARVPRRVGSCSRRPSRRRPSRQRPHQPRASTPYPATCPLRRGTQLTPDDGVAACRWASSAMRRKPTHFVGAQPPPCTHRQYLGVLSCGGRRRGCMAARGVLVHCPWWAASPSPPCDPVNGGDAVADGVPGCTYCVLGRSSPRPLDAWTVPAGTVQRLQPPRNLAFGPVHILLSCVTFRVTLSGRSACHVESIRARPCLLIRQLISGRIT